MGGGGARNIEKSETKEYHKRITDLCITGRCVIRSSRITEGLRDLKNIVYIDEGESTSAKPISNAPWLSLKNLVVW